MSKRFSNAKRSTPEKPVEPTPERHFVQVVRPKNEHQAQFMDVLLTNEVSLGMGPAGTGKTYLAVCAAVTALKENKVQRIVLTRPVVESGESLGYLPGTLEEKMDPYLRPLYDILIERMGAGQVRKLMANKVIEIAPIAYMRGRTLNNSFVLVDEAQNMTLQQLKMVLTRLGFGSFMVLTGDPDQSDLPGHSSGLPVVAGSLGKVDGIAIVEFTMADIVRNPLIGAMLEVLP